MRIPVLSLILLQPGQIGALHRRKVLETDV